jgi:hypothetical protein
MSTRHEELAVDLDEKIAKVTGTLARADDSWSENSWMKFIKEQQLYFGMDLPLLTDVGHPSAESNI